MGQKPQVPVPLPPPTMPQLPLTGVWSCSMRRQKTHTAPRSAPKAFQGLQSALNSTSTFSQKIRTNVNNVLEASERFWSAQEFPIRGKQR